jgi:hypothetical protein
MIRNHHHGTRIVRVRSGCRLTANIGTVHELPTEPLRGITYELGRTSAGKLGRKLLSVAIVLGRYRAPVEGLAKMLRDFSRQRMNNLWPRGNKRHK